VTAASIPGLTLAGEPRVQLLPPSVKEREKSRAARRMMGLLVILAVVVAGAGTGLAFWMTMQAEGRLVQAQALTLDILSQQAEYSEGAQVAGQVTATEQALTALTANEVDWQKLTGDVLAYLPCACVAADIALVGPAPWEPALIPEGPLRPARVAAMTIVLNSASYSSAADFLLAVRTMEGVADAVITDTKLDGGEYATTVVLTFDASVLALRYAPVSDVPADAATDDEPTVDAAATPAPVEGAVP